MTVWRLMAHWHEPDKTVAWARKNGRVGIGWDDIGDVRLYSSAQAISEAVKSAIPGLSNWPFSGTQLWDFSRVMQKDDFVILGTFSGRAQVMQIIGDYEFNENSDTPAGGCLHQRAARVVAVNPDTLWKLAGSDAAPGYSKRWTLFKCALPVTEARIKLA